MHIFEMPFHEANRMCMSEEMNTNVAQLQQQQQAEEQGERKISCKTKKCCSVGYRFESISTTFIMGSSSLIASIILGLSIILIQISTPSNAHSLLQNRHTPSLLNNNNANNNNNNNIEIGPPMTQVAANNQNGVLDNSISGSLGGGLNGQRQPNAISLNGGYQNRCPSGWMWFNNKCWVATQSRRDFSHAVELCRKLYNSSTLPTIHTEEENEFLRQKLDLKNSPIWLFARHNHQYNKTRWLDRTGVNFTHWDAGQPSDKASLVCIRTEDNWYMKKTEVKDGQTECVSFWEDGKWGTQVGCQVLLPVVCERKLTAMAKYQIQQNNANGSEPSSEYLANNGASSAASATASRMLQFEQLITLFSLIALISYKNNDRLIC